MRIGIDLRPLLHRPLSGVGEYTLQLVTAMLRHPGEDSFVLYANSFRESFPLPKDWPRDHIVYHPRRIPNKFLHASLRLLHRPAIDQLLGGVDVLFAPNIDIIAVSSRVPLVLTVHDLSFVHYPHLFSLKRRLWHWAVSPKNLIDSASRIIAVSDATGKDLQQSYHVPAEKISVIHSGVRTQSVSHENRERIQKKYRLPGRFLFALATFEPRKNFPAVLAAYTMVRQAGEYDGGLVIAGAPGWDRGSLNAALRNHPYRRSIHVLEYVPDDEKHVLYNLAECFLYLSVYEGFGFPPLEALAQGTPVIAGHHSSLSEILGTAALLVDVHNIRDVATGIRLLTSETALRSGFIQRGRAVVENCTWEDAAKKTLELLRKIAAGGTLIYSHKDHE